MLKNSIIESLTPSISLSHTNSTNTNEECESDLNPFVRVTFADISVSGMIFKL